MSTHTGRITKRDIERFGVVSNGVKSAMQVANCLGSKVPRISEQFTADMACDFNDLLDAAKAAGFENVLPYAAPLATDKLTPEVVLNKAVNLAALRNGRKIFGSINCDDLVANGFGAEDWNCTNLGNGEFADQSARWVAKVALLDCNPTSYKQIMTTNRRSPRNLFRPGRRPEGVQAAHIVRTGVMDLAVLTLAQASNLDHRIEILRRRGVASDIGKTGIKCYFNSYYDGLFADVRASLEPSWTSENAGYSYSIVLDRCLTARERE